MQQKQMKKCSNLTIDNEINNIFNVTAGTGSAALTDKSIKLGNEKTSCLIVWERWK